MPNVKPSTAKPEKLSPNLVQMFVQDDDVDDVNSWPTKYAITVALY